MPIVIYGASDDNVEIDGHPNGDEVGCYEQDVEVTIIDLVGAAGVIVTMHYGAGNLGVWSATLRQLDEGKAMIPCRVTHTSDDRGVGYSARVEVDAGPDAVLTWRKFAMVGE